MSLALPKTLSPSKVTAFTHCPLAFKYVNIDGLDDPAGPAAVKGTLVHLTLEWLHEFPAEWRTYEAGLEVFRHAWDHMQANEEFVALDLDVDGKAVMYAEAIDCITAYFTLEDPMKVHAVGLELMLGMDFQGTFLRGIIDRLDLEDDGLVVVDYKSGKAPSERYETDRMVGLGIYASLVKHTFGVLPVRVKLIYLGGDRPTTIVATVTENSNRRGQKRVQAVWSAIERGCAKDDFRPKVSFMCNWCSFKPKCPAHQGES